MDQKPYLEDINGQLSFKLDTLEIRYMDLPIQVFFFKQFKEKKPVYSEHRNKEFRN